jgi:hypothetical protein
LHGIDPVSILRQIKGDTGVQVEDEDKD